MGKTEWGAQETAKYALGEHPYRQIHAPIEIWCACPSYDSQKDTTQKKLQRYIPQHRIKPNGITWIRKGIWSEVILDTGTKLNFKSYDQGRAKFQGAGKRLIWFDEEPPRDIWEECFVRAEAGIPLDIIMTMTPVNGMTWVYDDIYLDTDNPDLFVSEADWEDNPWLTEPQKAKMLRGLSPAAIEVRKKGKFVKKTGLVCPWWQRGVHVKDITFNPDWQIGGSLDFGFSNPACFELIGCDYDDNLNIFDGFYETQLTTPKMCQRIVSLCAPYGINLKNLVIVADSAQAQSIQEMNDYSGENNLGFTVIGVKKVTGTASDNWDEYRADKMQQYGAIDDNGKTKVIVSSRLMYFDEKVGHTVNWFVKEVESLKWNEVASPNGSDKQQGSMWDPRYANHAIDTFTYYLVDHLESPALPEQKKPWEGKIPGTFIPPSVEDEEENNWNAPSVTSDMFD